MEPDTTPNTTHPNRVSGFVTLTDVPSVRHSVRRSMPWNVWDLMDADHRPMVGRTWGGAASIGTTLRRVADLAVELAFARPVDRTHPRGLASGRPRPSDEDGHAAGDGRPVARCVGSGSNRARATDGRRVLAGGLGLDRGRAGGAATGLVAVGVEAPKPPWGPRPDASPSAMHWAIVTFVPWTYFDPDRRVEPTIGAEDEACPRGGRERSGF